MKRVPSNIASRFIPLISVILVAVSMSACDSSRMISGVYRSEGPVVIQGAEGFAEARWIELVLAQFGPDLTGIVRVFDEEQFVIAPAGMCDCRYLDDGSVEGSDVTLAFPGHGDCPGSYETPLILGDLTFEEPMVVDQNAGDILTGSFIVEGGDRSTAQNVIFKRVKAWSDIGDGDLECDDPIVHGGSSETDTGGGQ